MSCVKKSFATRPEASIPCSYIINYKAANLSLKALKGKGAKEGIMVTEAQLAALESKQQDDLAFGEMESAHPGYLGSQDNFYVVTIKGVAPEDQKIMDTLSKEVVTEQVKDRHRRGFDHNLISQIPSVHQKEYKQNTVFRPKFIFAFGCASVVLFLVLLNPFPKLKLIIPSEREKFDRQMQLLAEIKETQKQIEEALHILT